MVDSFGDQTGTVGAAPEAEPGAGGVGRGPLREGRVFVAHDEQWVIGECLRGACLVLGEAVAVARGLERAVQGCGGEQYWDEGQVQELEGLTLDALGTVEQAWKALCVVTDAHDEQLRAADDARYDDTDDDTDGGSSGTDDSTDDHDDSGVGGVV
ncbi:hypothetical protein [Pseudonocardia sp. ICBG162]|uniref:hypothetical protein n=1 Tax=Pseudonocardia sp. ICBG162 TaxID=2846761 RepID=UPI001CF71288|nr:hypothetical protein [Pseudonocardia sp. ICBG162]